MEPHSTQPVAEEASTDQPTIRVIFTRSQTADPSDLPPGRQPQTTRTGGEAFLEISNISAPAQPPTLPKPTNTRSCFLPTQPPVTRWVFHSNLSNVGENATSDMSRPRRASAFSAGVAA